eukprot:Nk52_evm14s539 gene=Nk52_evmTU14s539
MSSRRVIGQIYKGNSPNLIPQTFTAPHKTAEPSADAPRLFACQLVGSLSNKLPKHRKTLEALSLTKRHRVIVHKNTPVVAGMLRAVAKFVRVDPIKVREVTREEAVREGQCVQKGVQGFLNSRGEFLYLKEEEMEEEKKKK